MKLRSTATLLLFLSACGAAQSPSTTLSVSGLLVDATGAPVTGNADIEFRIYDAATGGVPLWNELHPAVALSSTGRYHVKLGASTPLTPALFATPDRWLALDVASDGEMSPRLALSPTPYAHDASLLEGSPAATFAPRAELVDGTPVTTPVGWDDLLGVPMGLSDGDDDTTYMAGPGLVLLTDTFAADFAGTGVATTLARSDHDHDADYARSSHLLDLDPMTAPVHWLGLIGMPAGFADGTDDDTTYSAGSGLSLLSTTFSVDFSGGGAASTAARSDHDHPLLETRVTDLEMDVMTLMAGGGGGGGGGSLTYPDGLSGIEPVTLSALASSPYTVPGGKNLYLTVYHSQSTSWNVTVDGIAVFSGLSSYGASGYSQHVEQPIVAGAGSTIASNNNSVSANGFLVDAKVTPVSRAALAATPYTVPAGMVMVITNYHSQSTSWNLTIGGVAVYSGICSYGASGYLQRMGLPVLATAGEQIGSNNNSVSINGYLTSATVGGGGGGGGGGGDPALAALGAFGRALLVTTSQVVPAGKIWRIDSIAHAGTLTPTFPSSSSIRTQSGQILIDGGVAVARAVYAIETSGPAGGDGAGIGALRLIDLPFYLPAGTTLAASTGSSFIAVSEFEASASGGQVLLISSPLAVPAGKAWSLRGAAHADALTPLFPSSSSIRARTAQVVIGGTAVALRAVYAIETSGPAGSDGAGIHGERLLDLPLVLPAGTTLAPGTDTSVLCVIEFTP